MTRPRMHETGRQVEALQRIDAVSLAAALSLLSPDHPVVTAARTGIEVGELRDKRREAMRQAGKEIAAGWRYSAMDAVKHDELARRRDWSAQAEVRMPRQRAEDVDPELAAAFAVAEAEARSARADDEDGDGGGDDDEDLHARDDTLVDVDAQ